ncbi:HNH endonuclease [Candidatus Poribacteria bacterium]|nr:HNH endonuclease [Candidatus Poribacteria bacterium]MYK19442.1 HNH endonuclease [Candidatus Poribacteria bacterium]
MNDKTPPRIRRRASPPKMQGRMGYRNAEPYLRQDFDYRCAYCGAHEQLKGGPHAFCVDHFKPRSKRGPVNDYSNLYWVCIPCNMIKHDKWPTSKQRRRGYRFADPCREMDYGVHFLESDEGFLKPITACGEYHISMLRLNRAWLQQHRQERTRKWTRFTEASQLYEELKRIIEARPTNAATQMMRRLLTFLSEEIKALRSELAVAIPRIPMQRVL